MAEHETLGQRQAARIDLLEKVLGSLLRVVESLVDQVETRQRGLDAHQRWLDAHQRRLDAMGREITTEALQVRRRLTVTREIGGPEVAMSVTDTSAQLVVSAGEGDEDPHILVLAETGSSMSMSDSASISAIAGEDEQTVALVERPQPAGSA